MNSQQQARREEIAKRQQERKEKFRQRRQARELSGPKAKTGGPKKVHQGTVIRPQDVARAQATFDMPEVPVPGDSLVKATSGLNVPLPKAFIDQLVQQQRAAMEELMAAQMPPEPPPVEEEPEPEPEEPKKLWESEAAAAKILNGLYGLAIKNKIELAPVASMVVLYATANAMHSAGTPTAWAALAGAVGSGFQWVWFAPRTWKTVEAVKLARLVTVCASAYLTASTLVSPKNSVMLGALLVGVAAGSWYWLTNWSPVFQRLVARLPWVHSRRTEIASYVEECEIVDDPPEPEPVPEPEPPTLEEEWNVRWEYLLALPRLKKLQGSKVIRVQKHGEMHWTITVQLVPGIHLPSEALTAEVEQAMAGGLRVQFDRPMPPDAVRSFAEKTDGTIVHFMIRALNPLRKTITWEEVKHHAPTTIRQPLALGLWEDFSPGLAGLLGRNFLFGGSVGAGKSNGVATLMSSIAGCEDALIWFIDLKGGIAAQPWMPRIDWLAVDLDTAGDMLRALKLLVEVRANEADFAGDKIKPKRDMPAVILVIDEMAELIGDRSPMKPVYGPILESIVSRGRAVAVPVIGATQFCSLTSMFSSTLREQFRTNFAMGSRDESAGSFLLGKDAWGKLDVSKLDLAGTFFLREDTSNPLVGRFPLMPDMEKLVEEGKAEWWEAHPIAKEHADLRPELEHITDYRLRQLIGEPYINRREILLAQPLRVSKALRLQQQAAAAAPSEAPLEGGSVLTLERGEQAPLFEPTEPPLEGGLAEGGASAPSYDVGMPRAEGGLRGGSDEDEEAPFERASRLRQEMDRIADGMVLTPERIAELNAVMGRIDLTAVMAEKVSYFGSLLANAPESGIKNEVLQEQVGVGKDWTHTRLSLLIDAGAILRVSKGYYAPAPGVDVRIAVAKVEADLKARRADARRVLSGEAQ
jgi:hypothetical protein